MKRIFLGFGAAVLSIMLCASMTSVAADNNAAEEPSKTGAASNVNITVVIPSDEDVKPAETLSEPKEMMFPISVEMTDNGNQRFIAKSYELSGGQKPEDIPRGDFEQDGYSYVLTDVIKNVAANNITKEQVETVTVETESKDMDDILAELPVSIKHGKGGYAGELKLDVSSIVIESKGTGWASYPVTKTREYPYLSSNDTSLIPKTITDGGVTLTLDDVQWRAATTTNIDYHSVEETYTAIASYTGTASYSYTKGYEVTAEYKGDVHKAAVGKTTYTAHFTGTKIPPEPISFITETETAEADLIEDEGPSGDNMEETSADNGYMAFVIILAAALTAVLIFLLAGERKKATLLKKELVRKDADIEYFSSSDKKSYTTDDIMQEIFKENYQKNESEDNSNEEK